MAGAAYLMGDAAPFENATKNLMCAHNTNVSSLRKAEGGDLLPWSGLLDMAQRRCRAQRTLSSGLARTWDEINDAKCDCVCDFHRQPVDDSVSQWPPLFGDKNVTLANLAKQMRDQVRTESCEECRSIYGNGYIYLRALAEKVEDICKGLCILCAAEEKFEVDGYRCRH